jgi:DNA-binding CsgD family transcriptional regulator
MGRSSEPGVLATGLTATERRILEFHASGLTRTEIAIRLGRSPQTISNSLTIAKEKLKARSLSEAAALISALGVREDSFGA